jgi:hypothetical protein
MNRMSCSQTACLSASGATCVAAKRERIQFNTFVCAVVCMRDAPSAEVAASHFTLLSGHFAASNSVVGWSGVGVNVVKLVVPLPFTLTFVDSLLLVDDPPVRSAILAWAVASCVDSGKQKFRVVTEKETGFLRKSGTDTSSWTETDRGEKQRQGDVLNMPLEERRNHPCIIPAVSLLRAPCPT